MKKEQKTWCFTRQTMGKHQAVKCSWLSCEDFLELLRSEKAKKATQRLRDLHRAGGDITRQIQSLPRIFPSAEFRKTVDGKVQMTQFNGVIALELSGQSHDEALSAAKYATSLLPFTVASFVGAQGNNVIVLVRVSRPDDSLPADETAAGRFCEEAYPLVQAIYIVALGHTLRPVTSPDTENLLRCHFPLSFDESPYYHPETLRVPAANYEGNTHDASLVTEDYEVECPECNQVFNITVGESICGDEGWIDKLDNDAEVEVEDTLIKE